MAPDSMGGKSSANTAVVGIVFQSKTLWSSPKYLAIRRAHTVVQYPGLWEFPARIQGIHFSSASRELVADMLRAEVLSRVNLRTGTFESFRDVPITRDANGTPTLYCGAEWQGGEIFLDTRRAIELAWIEPHLLMTYPFIPGMIGDWVAAVSRSIERGFNPNQY